VYRIRYRKANGALGNVPSVTGFMSGGEVGVERGAPEGDEVLEGVLEGAVLAVGCVRWSCREWARSGRRWRSWRYALTSESSGASWSMEGLCYQVVCGANDRERGGASGGNLAIE
jgi:hypothetical protein